MLRDAFLIGPKAGEISNVWVAFELAAGEAPAGELLLIEICGAMAEVLAPAAPIGLALAELHIGPVAPAVPTGDIIDATTAALSGLISGGGLLPRRKAGGFTVRSNLLVVGPRRSPIELALRTPALPARSETGVKRFFHRQRDTVRETIAEAVSIPDQAPVTCDIKQQGHSLTLSLPACDEPILITLRGAPHHVLLSYQVIGRCAVEAPTPRTAAGRCR
jgi:hypothetical protein